MSDIKIGDCFKSKNNNIYLKVIDIINENDTEFPYKVAGLSDTGCLRSDLHRDFRSDGYYIPATQEEINAQIDKEIEFLKTLKEKIK